MLQTQNQEIANARNRKYNKLQNQEITKPIILNIAKPQN